MLVRGQGVPVVGVSLERTVLDLTDIDRPELGEEVVVLGQSGEDRWFRCPSP